MDIVAIVLLGKSSSINVRKVLWALAETGLDYRQEEWGEGFRSTSLPEFLKLNPNGLVPVIRHGEFVLWESNTIVRYIASIAGRLDLLPENPHQRAEVEKWMDWQAGEFNNSWRYAFQALVRKNPAFDNPKEIEKSITSWNEAISLVEQQLAETGAYICGSAFTVADIVIGLSVNRWQLAPLDHQPVPAIDRYMELLADRRGYADFVGNGMP